MNTDHHIPSKLTIHLWEPNRQDVNRLRAPRHARAIKAATKHRRWKKLAERMRFLPREGRT